MSAPSPTAEHVVLSLCRVLLGDPTKRNTRGQRTDHGLLSLVIDGYQHSPRCPFGQHLTPGLGGDPCSDRCRAAHAAIDLAGAWLRANEGQAVLEEVAG